MARRGESRTQVLKKLGKAERRRLKKLDKQAARRSRQQAASRKPAEGKGANQ
jgi:hypothetical protein